MTLAMVSRKRHALYAANPAAFAGILTNLARETFDVERAENEQA